MPFDSFMYIVGGDGVPVRGETLDKDFASIDGTTGFEIKSFKVDVENPHSLGSSGGGAGTGKASLKPFEVTKVTDNCSPSLFKSCTTGTHYQKAVIALRKAGGQAGKKSGSVYLRFTFQMVFVNSVSWNGSSGDDLPEETVQFAYATIKVEYFPQQKAGTMNPTANEQLWNQVTNTDDPDVPEVGTRA
jgi:type VI secretion system secreted protein Hcp